jgi:hypothetical protein
MAQDMAFNSMINAQQQQMQQMQQLNSLRNQQQMQQAQMAQENNSTYQQINTVQQQIQSENQKAQAQRHQLRLETDNKVREMANETYINRVKTSDKQQKAVLDFVKG